MSQSESALAGARAVYENAKRDFERDGELLNQHIIARETYDLSSEHINPRSRRLRRRKRR